MFSCSVLCRAVFFAVEVALRMREALEHAASNMQPRMGALRAGGGASATGSGGGVHCNVDGCVRERASEKRWSTNGVE